MTSATSLSEPVAAVHVTDGVIDATTMAIIGARTTLPDGTHELYPAPPSAEQIRREAFEECARLCDEIAHRRRVVEGRPSYLGAEECAAAIRKRGGET